MEKRDKIRLILKTAFFYIIVDALFSLPGKLTFYLVYQHGLAAPPKNGTITDLLGYALGTFLNDNLYWLIAVAAVEAAILIYFVATKVKIKQDVFQSETVRLMTGVLAAVSGIIALVSQLSRTVMDILSYVQISNLENLDPTIMSDTFTVAAVTAITTLLQILYGVSLAVQSKKAATPEQRADTQS